MASEETYRAFEKAWIRKAAGEISTEEWIGEAKNVVHGALRKGERGQQALDLIEKLEEMGLVAGPGLEPGSEW